MQSICAKKVWTCGGWLEHVRVDIENGIIQGLSPVAGGLADVPLLIPGMLELHVHGAMGYSVSNPHRDEAASWLKRLAAHGVTGVLPSPGCAPLESLRRSVAFFAGLMAHPVPGGARILGVHLEGPFINAQKKGGMDERWIIPPSIQAFEQIAGQFEHAVRIVTLAPETAGALALIRHLTERGIAVNAGHSNATASQMRAGIRAGLNGVTHFFNAARPIHHRDPGLLTAALLSPDVFCEMIGDQVHLAPEIMQLLVRTAGPRRVAVITDAVPLTGMPDGEYGAIQVTNGSPRMRDGTLTGGCMMMDEIARGMIDIGFDPWDVFCMTSHTPARRIGLTAHGDIAPRYTANLTAMSEDYQVLFALLEGEQVNG